MSKSATDLTLRAQNLAMQAALKPALALPYEKRVRFMGWLMSRVVAPALRWDRRIEKNLAMVLPDLPEADVRRLVRSVPDNAGRTLIENFSTEELLKRAADTPITGEGLAAFEEAQAAGRPVILATGHFGNYEAGRAALTRRGHTIGGLYRPLTNPYFNESYRRTMEAFGGPVVPQGRQGTAAFVRALKDGRAMVLLFDLFVHEGEEIPFMGRPVRTALSAAELSLRYGADLIPFYAIRQPDGLTFEVEMDAPVPHSDPATMTRALNESLEARIATHMDQWFWVHRRWKKQPKDV